jgi:NAD(P)-dependent dehydrogenase (short-subunit alcohol dehydrogenase family)
MRLKDKVAIVTGGAQGIGKAYVMRLAQEGAKVVIADIQEGKDVEKAVADMGGQALALHADVADEGSTREMAERTVRRFGRIDILINNAAYFSTIVKKPFHEIGAAEWDAVIAVNLKGTFLCSKAVFPQMKAQGKGKIVNVASGTFYKGSPRFLHYVTTKGGVIALTRALAREVGDFGICVNAIAPGYTETEFLKQKPQDGEEVRNVNVMSRCIKRPETPEDLTGTIVFLASEDSDFLTGQTIVVDGGSCHN